MKQMGKGKDFFVKNRYIFTAVFLIVSLVFFGTLMIKRYQEVIKKELNNTARESSLIISEVIEYMLKDADSTADMLSQSATVKGFLSGNDAYIDDVNEELDFYCWGKPFVCYVINLDGLTVLSSNRGAPDSFVGKNYKFRPYFYEALEKEKSFYFALGITSNIRGYYSSALVRDAVGNEVGVVVVKKEIHEEQGRLSELNDFVFTNEQGIVFLSKNPKYIFSSIYPLDEEQQERIKESRQFGEGPFNALFKERIKSGDQVVLDGKKVIVAKHKVAQEGWQVVVFEAAKGMIAHDLLLILPLFILGFLIIGFFYYLHQKDSFVAQLKRSERRYMSIFEAGPQVTLILNAEYEVIACNSKITPILGYQAADALGKPGLGFLCSGNTGKWIWDLVNENGQVKEIIVRGHYKNGKSVDVCINANLIDPTKKDKNTFIVCVLEDVTQRLIDLENLRQAKDREGKSAHEAKLTREATLNILEDLQEAKNSIEADRRGFLNVIENSWDGMIIVDKNKIVRFVNKSAQLIYGKDRTELLDKSFPHSINAEEVGNIRITHDKKSTLVEIRVTQTEWMQEEMQLVVMHDVTAQEESRNLLQHAAEEWRRTFDAIGDGVSLLNEKGQVLRCNKAAAKIFDKPFPDVIGINCIDFFHSEEEGYKCVIKNTIATGRRSTGTYKVGDRWFLSSADPLEYQGMVSGVVHTMADITAQKDNEQKIKESAEYIENIVETAQAIIVVLDTEFRVKSMNKFAEHLLGYNRENVIGNEWIDLVVAPEYKEEIRQVFFNCLEGERVRGFEMPIISKENREILISWYSAELQGADGQIIGLVTMGYDVSQRKEMEKVQRLAQLGTLVSHMAHEVNNPLMVISGRAQLSLMEEIQNQEVKDNLNVVLKECKRAKDIIQRLLRFSRPSKGEINEIDINKSLGEVISLLEHQFKLENISIFKNISSGLSFVKGDEKQLHEVFMNLLTNAQDAIEGQGSITIETKEKDEFINITFKDTGAGISKEVLTKIFDPFFTTKKKGTGLGLAICKSIIEEHKGSLKVESVEGQGTTMTILLPINVKEQDNV